MTTSDKEADTIPGNSTFKKHTTMALEQQIQKDIMAAMKAHDTVRLNAVRGIKSAILLAKTSGNGNELTDGDIQNLIRKLVKQRKEAAELYVQGGRQELADNELAEAAFMEEYLPAAPSEAELEERIGKIIAEVGASNSDMGKVMGVATKALAGLADGKTISAIVKKLLAQ